MPIDTSIALGVRPPQFRTIDPMTIYSAMENQRINALREQALQQDMQRNALAMQYAAEDRRAAAAKAAQEQALLAKRRDILGQFGTTDQAVGRRGVGYSGTGVSNDPYAFVANKLIGLGDIGTAEALRKTQNEALTGQKTSAETEGIKLANVTKQFDIINAGLDRAVTPDAMYALYKAVPDALAVRGQTPETAYQAFNAHVAELSKTMSPDKAFAQARMDVAHGAMAVQKQLSEIAAAQKPEIMTDASGNLISANAYTATATPFRMAAPASAPTAAGAPAAGAPAAAGEPVKATPKGGLTENQKMQLKARTSDDFGMATETLRYVQDIERDIKSLTDADISGATGYQSYLPSFNTDTIRAEKTLTELRDKVGALGRTLASMSGKLGNLAVQEYEFLRQQVALIDPTAGEKDVKRQLAKAEASMKRIANTVRDRYSREYGGEDNPFPQFRELPKEVGAETKSGAANKSGTTSSGISYSIED